MQNILSKEEIHHKQPKIPQPDIYFTEHESINYPTSTAHQPFPMFIEMRHPITGKERRVDIGFSRAVLLWGPLALAKKGDWIGVLACIAMPLAGQIMLAPVANKRHLRRLIAEGYYAVSNTRGHISHAEWLMCERIPRYRNRQQSPGHAHRRLTNG